MEDPVWVVLVGQECGSGQEVMRFPLARNQSHGNILLRERESLH